jgi:hypothetical protein
VMVWKRMVVEFVFSSHGTHGIQGTGP